MVITSMHHIAFNPAGTAGERLRQYGRIQRIDQGVAVGEPVSIEHLIPRAAESATRTPKPFAINAGSGLVQCSPGAEILPQFLDC